MSLTRPFLAAALLLAMPVSLAGPALAQTAEAPTPAPATGPTEAPAGATIAALAETLQLDALFDVLREEGLEYGTTLETEMFPGGGGPQWTGAVSAVYDTRTLRTRFDAALQAGLGDDPETLAEVLAFFGSELGQKVVGLEIDARRAFLTTETEEAARVAADDRFASRDPKFPLLRRFIEAGDLIEMNVAGGLSGNLAFLTGLSETGVYGQTKSPGDLMSDVWGQEEQVRDDTTSWLYAYLGLAYDPLTEGELLAYVEFMESAAGKKLNGALFAAFEAVFRPVSYDLGRAAGAAMLGSDI